jgi:anti-sigma factor (TIGR02949 family)
MTVSCEHVRRLLAPWVDGAITATDRARIDAHLSACSACATRAARERSARDVLQRRRPELLADTAPEGLRARIQADARGGRPVPAAGLGWRRVPISIAATLVLAFSGLTLHLATGRSTTLLAAQLAADHVKCHLLQRDDGAADPTEVQHRLAERYGFRARVPASSIEQRLRLVGARRCLTGEGTNAHILYRLDGRPVSLYLVPNEMRPAVSVRVLGRDAVVWSRDNGTYVLVADGGASDLGRVARYMPRATE